MKGRTYARADASDMRTTHSLAQRNCQAYARTRGQSQFTRLLFFYLDRSPYHVSFFFFSRWRRRMKKEIYESGGEKKALEQASGPLCICLTFGCRFLPNAARSLECRRVRRQKIKGTVKKCGAHHVMQELLSVFFCGFLILGPK